MDSILPAQTLKRTAPFQIVLSSLLSSKCSTSLMPYHQPTHEAISYTNRALSDITRVSFNHDYNLTFFDGFRRSEDYNST